jgi:hypothetical protein
MTTVARHLPTSTRVHLPRRSPRKVVAALVIASGAAMVAVTFANNLFNVGPSFESMMGDFRPHLTSTAISQTRTDVAGLGAAGTELQTKMVPAMAQQLGMTPAQFSAYIAQTYPQVATGMTQLPQIVTTFDGLVTTLDQQRPLFRSADAIPTKSIPATTLPWMLAGLGVVLVLVGGTMWFSPQAGAATAVVLGALMIALPLVLSLPQKASDADDLNANLKPVYTAAMVTQAKDALATVSALGSQLQTAMLPALATQLHLTPAQLQQMMATSFPATAAAIGNLPTALPRFQTLVADFDSNLGNYDTLKPVSFVPIIWTTMGLGLLTLIGGSVALLWPRHKLYFVL